MKKNLLFSGMFLSLFSLSFAQTTLTLQPDGAAGKDAEVYSCAPCGYTNQPHGSKPDLDAIAWTNGGNSSNIRSLIEFDLTAIPVNATITSAQLSLYYNPTSIEGTHFSSFLTPNSSYLLRVTAPWTESTVTWNNQPPTTNTNRVSLAASSSSTQNYTNINVKAMVQDMVRFPAQNFGFMLKLQTEKKFRKLILASSDNANAALRPKLVVTYTVPPSPVVADPNNNKTIINATPVSPFTFSLAPNPAKESVKLTFNYPLSSQGQLTVTDILGKTVYSEAIENSLEKMDMNISSLKKGVYLVAIKCNGYSIVKRLVVE